MFSGYSIGGLAERFGWSTAWLGLCAVAMLGLFSAICYWRLNERLLNAPGESATPNTQLEN